MENIESKKTNDASWRQVLKNNSNGAKWLMAFGVFLFLAMIAVIGLIVAISHRDKQNRESEAKWNQQHLDDQIANVKSGRTKCITFYCSSGTDGLLAQLNKVPQVEGVVLNLTDVTDDGMKSIATLKNLKYFRLYAGNVSDQGFALLKDATGLEHLELVNTRITDKSLPLLKKMPNLTFLALSYEARLGSTFTEAGLENLKSLTKLKKLYLCDGWASKAAIEKLQKVLPDCTISTEDGDLVM
jgi:hypothetical protein